MDVNEKYMLTIKEAAEYYNIGTKSLRRIVENGKRSSLFPVQTRL